MSEEELQVEESTEKARPRASVSDIVAKAKGIASRVNRALSPGFLVPPRSAVLVAALAMASALVMCVEAVQFNMLLLVSNYVNATAVISIAMLGIAIGGFLAFALSKLRPSLVIALAAALLLFSLALSYLSIVDFAAIGFPYYMILPYVAASLIVSVILAQTKSTISYFANLAASGLGAIAPIFLVPAFKSEGALLSCMFVPIAILFLLCLRIKNLVPKVLGAALAVAAAIAFAGFLAGNRAYPEKIAKDVFENKILSEMAVGPKDKAEVNFAADFLKRAYRLDKDGGIYRFSSDAYDYGRARYFLGVLGFSERFGQKWLGLFEKRPYLKDPRAIPAAVFENDLLRAANRRYRYAFRRDYDLEFLRSAYTLTGDAYLLSKDRYARERAKILLGDLGHFPYLDLALDLRRNGYYDDYLKSFNSNARIVLDEDSTLGRVQYTRSNDRFNMAINGTLLDNMDSYDGNYFDPRVPYMEKAKTFIVGLSADGIPKSVKLHPGAKVSGVELNPVIWRTMTDGGFYQSYSADPYKNVAASMAEGRSSLEHSKEKYDLITLMNIHQDSGPASTLGPENFATVEANRMMLSRLTERGMIDYEEIQIGRRSELAFLKLMNTLKAALRASGQDKPEACIHVSKWDFWGGDVFRTVLVKNNPFTKAETAALSAYLEKSKATGFYTGVAVIFDPLSPSKTSFDAFVRGPDALSRRELPGRVAAADFAARVLAKSPDPRDADFAQRYYKYGGDGTYSLRDADIADADRYRLEGIMDRAGYSLGIDLSPVRDDAPFPFNVYAKKTEVTDILSRLWPLALLLALPLLIVLLRGSGEHKTPLLPPVLFAAIAGFGYMLVEIVLMQKFQLFIGDPTRALIVVMAGMLVFSGVGSFVSGLLPRKALIAAVAAIPVLLALYAWKIDSIFAVLHFLQGWGKLTAAALILLPLCFLMGFPFPNALEAIKARTSPDFASLLFGVNGLASTLGAATAFLINVSSGYHASFALGTACYAVATSFFIFFILSAGKGGSAA